MAILIGLLHRETPVGVARAERVLLPLGDALFGSLRLKLLGVRVDVELVVRLVGDGDLARGILSLVGQVDSHRLIVGAEIVHADARSEGLGSVLHQRGAVSLVALERQLVLQRFRSELEIVRCVVLPIAELSLLLQLDEIANRGV